MAPILYKGKTRAAKIKKQVAKKIATLQKKTGITPTLAIIKVSESDGVDLYTRMKEKAAEEVGAQVEIYDMSHTKHSYIDIMQMIRFLGRSDEYHGVMVQLPLPFKMRNKEYTMFDVFNPEKDVDGMSLNSDFMKPVTLAVLDAIKDYKKKMKIEEPRILVVGSKGFVGSDIMRVVEKTEKNVRGVDKNIKKTFSDETLARATREVDLIISATGKQKVFYHQNVRSEKVAFIDVGAPKAEVDVPYLKDKIIYLTPVPGGIGPVTIAYLLENLYKAAYNMSRKARV